jgi:hypothetical protein
MGRIVSRPAGKAGQPHIRKIRGELRRPKGSRLSKLQEETILRNDEIVLK